MMENENRHEQLRDAAIGLARTYSHSSVGSDHLLRVLCMTEEGRRQLEAMGADYSAIVEFLEQSLLSRPARFGQREVPGVTEEFESIFGSPNPIPAVLGVPQHEQAGPDGVRVGHMIRRMLDHEGTLAVTRKALEMGGLTSERLVRADASGTTPQALRKMKEEEQDPESALFSLGEADEKADEGAGKESAVGESGRGEGFVIGRGPAGLRLIGIPHGHRVGGTSDPAGAGAEDERLRRIAAMAGLAAASPGLSTPPSGRDDERDRARKAVEGALRNLTEAASAGQLEPVIGREAEMEMLVEALQRRRKPNVLLLGEPGVGKTALAEGLAELLASDVAPEALIDRSVLEISMASLVAGTRYRGEFELRMEALIEICEGLQAILFIDEFHSVMGAGRTQAHGLDAANILKPALARSGFSVIGATTPAEARPLRLDRALMRRFSEIRIQEPNPDTTREILVRASGAYGKHHELTYEEDALDLAVDLADRFIPDQFFPDKALEVIDNAGAIAASSGEKEVRAEHVRMAVSRISGARIGKGSREERERLTNLPDQLRSRIFGQDQAIDVLSRAARIAHLGLASGGVAGAFLFNGPTGSGKTALASAFAAEMGLPLVRIDMSEFMERHAVSRLIGAPPGYVGYQDSGVLIEAADTHRSMVLLLDEAEKAHRDTFDILLQLLDEGRVTGSDGRTVSFRGSWVILTANLGAEQGEQAPFGFGREPDPDEAGEEAVQSAFRKELLGRIPNRIQFSALGSEARGQILAASLKEVESRLSLGGISLQIDEDVLELLRAEIRGLDGRGIEELVARVVADALSAAVADEPGAAEFTLSAPSGEVRAQSVGHE